MSTDGYTSHDSFGEDDGYPLGRETYQHNSTVGHAPSHPTPASGGLLPELPAGYYIGMRPDDSAPYVFRLSDDRWSMGGYGVSDPRRTGWTLTPIAEATRPTPQTRRVEDSPPPAPDATNARDLLAGRIRNASYDDMSEQHLLTAELADVIADDLLAAGFALPVTVDVLDTEAKP